MFTAYVVQIFPALSHVGYDIISRGVFFILYVTCNRETSRLGRDGGGDIIISLG